MIRRLLLCFIAVGATVMIMLETIALPLVFVGWIITGKVYNYMITNYLTKVFIKIEKKNHGI